jgi:hypothetical protein
MKPRPAPLSTPSAEGHVLPTLLALAYIREDGRWVHALHTLMLVHRSDGWVSDGGFPDEIAVNEALVDRINLPVVRFARGRLRVSATNGEAVYVPLGESPVDGCVRYGRLYLRPPATG